MGALNCEQLERREVPATLADILPYYGPAYIRPMPDVPAEQILVGTYDPSPLSPAGDDTRDIFIAHGDGNAVRVAVKAAGTSGAIEWDFFAFDPEGFRGGGEAFAIVGDTLYVTPGDGGGPVVAAIDLLTQEVRTFLVSGFDPTWRGGLKLSSFDVDWVGGFDPSPDPQQELIVLAAALGAGPLVSILNADGTSAREPFLFSDPDDRGAWDFVPAAVGVQVGGPGKIGMLLESADDPLTSVRVGWDGTIHPNTTAIEDYAAADPLPLGGVYVG